MVRVETVEVAKCADWPIIGVTILRGHSEVVV
jgi:hypothetical protein